MRKKDELYAFTICNRLVTSGDETMNICKSIVTGSLYHILCTQFRSTKIRPGGTNVFTISQPNQLNRKHLKKHEEIWLI